MAVCSAVLDSPSLRITVAPVIHARCLAWHDMKHVNGVLHAIETPMCSVDNAAELL